MRFSDLKRGIRELPEGVSRGSDGKKNRSGIHILGSARGAKIESPNHKEMYDKVGSKAKSEGTNRE